MTNHPNRSKSYGRARIHYSPRSGGLWVLADWSQASDSIRVAYSRENVEDDEFFSTPFQVADARHSPSEAARIVAGWAKSAHV